MLSRGVAVVVKRAAAAEQADFVQVPDFQLRQEPTTRLPLVAVEQDRQPIALLAHLAVIAYSAPLLQTAAVVVDQIQIRLLAQMEALAAARDALARQTPVALETPLAQAHRKVQTEATTQAHQILAQAVVVARLP